jgi:polyhydroxybutyrate depolymerase
MPRQFLFRRGFPIVLLLFVSACVAAQALVPEVRRGLRRNNPPPIADTTAQYPVIADTTSQYPVEVRAQTGDLATYTVSAGGMERMYYLHVPAGLDPSRPAPLVLAFHGGGGDAASFAGRSGLSRMADREGFIVAYPQGVKNSWNTQGSPAVGYSSRNGVDDVAFTRAMISRISADHAVNSSRVFAVGMSAGGMMAYTLACDMPNQIAAIAVVAGTLTDESCAGVTGVSLLHIHGTNDQNVPLDGGTGTMSAKRASYPPVMAGISMFAQRNQCAATGSISTPAQDTTCDVRACAGGESVTFCKVAPGGHAWPGTEPAPWQQENGVYVSPYFDATGQIEAFLRNR